MAKTKIPTLICVVLLGAIATLNGINADCCSSFTVHYICLLPSYEICTASICYDGTKVYGYYCGYGPCNVIGCNCAGGCRRNSKGLDYVEAKKLFSETYNEYLPD